MAIECGAGFIVENEVQPQMLHARALLNLHGRKHAQRIIRIGDDLERRGGFAGKHAPASFQFLAHRSFQRITPLVEIVACRDNVAVKRARSCAIEQRQRIAPAVEIDRHLAQANEIGTAGQPPQGRQQVAPQPARRLRIARRRDAQHRCVIVGQGEIGEFDDPHTVLHPADQGQEYSQFRCRRVRDDGNQRLDVVDACKCLVPRAEPARILERRRRVDIVPPRRRLFPVTDKFDAEAGRA